MFLNLDEWVLFSSAILVLYRFVRSVAEQTKGAELQLSLKTWKGLLLGRIPWWGSRRKGTHIHRLVWRFDRIKIAWDTWSTDSGHVWRAHHPTLCNLSPSRIQFPEYEYFRPGIQHSRNRFQVRQPCRFGTCLPFRLAFWLRIIF